MALIDVGGPAALVPKRQALIPQRGKRHHLGIGGAVLIMEEHRGIRSTREQDYRHTSLSALS